MCIYIRALSVHILCVHQQLTHRVRMYVCMYPHVHEVVTAKDIHLARRKLAGCAVNQEQAE